MSNESAEKRQAFEQWVSSLRPGTDASTIALGEESGVTSLDEQKTLVKRLPKDVVRTLREREAGRALANVDQDSTAIFHPPPELLARAKRLVPPAKPERSMPASAPPDPVTQSMPVVATLPAEDLVLLPELPAAPLPEPPLPEAAPPDAPLSDPPLPALADASEWDDAPAVMPIVQGPAPEQPIAFAPEPRRASKLAWIAVLLGAACVAASAWYGLTHSW